MNTKILITILLFLSGCGEKPAPLPNINNIPIPSEWSSQKTITLQNGLYSEEAAPDSASKIIIHATQYFAKGTIDDQKMLAAILITDPGGSGTFYDLFLFSEKDNNTQYIAQTPLGDRIQINRVGITDNMIKVSLSTRNATTPMAAEPDLPLIKSFILTDNQLSEPCIPEATPAITPPPATLAGKTFYWQSSIYGNDTQESPNDPARYSIRFNHDWTLDIHSDCHKTGGFFGLYNSRLTIRPDLPVDPCRQQSLSPVFLHDLKNAVNFFFQGKNLYIDMKYDSGTLLLTNHP